MLLDHLGIAEGILELYECVQAMSVYDHCFGGPSYHNAIQLAFAYHEQKLSRIAMTRLSLFGNDCTGDLTNLVIVSV